MFRIDVPAITEALLRVVGDELAHAGEPGRGIAIGLVRTAWDVPAADDLLEEAGSQQNLTVGACKLRPGDGLESVILEPLEGFQGGGEFFVWLGHKIKMNLFTRVYCA